MKKTLICVSCPLGCSLDIEYTVNKIVSVEGSTCKRGQIYAEKEIFNPERTVTSTVRIFGSKIDYLPVKTDSTVPKNKVEDVLNDIFKIRVEAPVKVGEIICKNIAGTSSNLVATRSLQARDRADCCNSK